jgi:hypothetical protein
MYAFATIEKKKIMSYCIQEERMYAIIEMSDLSTLDDTSKQKETQKGFAGSYVINLSVRIYISTCFLL